MLRSVNPFDQSLLGEFPEDDEQIINRKLEAAAKAFRSWKRESFVAKGALMKRAGDLLRSNKNEYAGIISREMGKVLKEAQGEVEKCAVACDYFAEKAEEFLKDEIIATEAKKSFVCFQPLGPVLAIMPWNFPFWQVFRFAVPSLMAGNVGLLKHASNVSQCSMAIESIFRDAGFPEGTFQSLLIDSKKVEGLISHEHVAAVTLTGSEFAGTKVAAVAGKNIKKTVLELGGSDPFIVLQDADLDLAAQVATQSRMQNAGQSCIAAKRFIVMGSVRDGFLDRFKKKVEALRQGNPLQEGITTGPLARVDLAEDLETQMNDSLKAGARVITGGKRDGANYQPAILDQVLPGMRAFDEEMFGPVAAMITVKDEREAIAMANQNRYGLGASVWTGDPQRGEKVAREIESGCVFVNSLMRSDQRLPFGGIKKSGYGRELSELGIKEFMNAKTIYVA
ncbi:MAG TPA: NAD-dependent succinate-semialdehyde dehydrogenase [Chryseosolibacter sp.]|nr:NAD-dependent succinate-semialdehyde dehydrogenase [Chryseosolibacter sp.]